MLCLSKMSFSHSSACCSKALDTRLDPTFPLQTKNPPHPSETGTTIHSGTCHSKLYAHVTLNYIPMQPVALEGGPSPKKEK